MRRSTWPTMAIHEMPATGLPTILGSITPSGRIRPSTTAVPPICIWGRAGGGVNRIFRRGRGTATPAGVAVPRPRLQTRCQAFHQGDRRHPHGKLAQKLCLTLGPPYATGENGKRKAITRECKEVPVSFGLEGVRIIDDETFNYVQARIAEGRSRHANAPKHDYLLARRLRCACGYKTNSSY